MLKAQLHCHTNSDPQDKHWVTYSSKELIDHAATLNFDVLGITCHNYIEPDTTLIAYAKSKGILLLLGIECDIEKKHVVLYGVTQQEADQLHNFEDLAKLRKTKEILSIAAHPLYPGTSCLGTKILKYPDLFDAWEFGFLYTHLINPNWLLKRWAKKHDKPIIGCGDVHYLKDLNRTYSYLDAQSTPESVFDAIKQGKVKIISTPLPLPEFTRIALRGVLAPLRRRWRRI